MPVRATKRGEERTPIDGQYDVIICGASFAGLTVAREIASTGSNILLLDRYEIGERSTSACAAPTQWLNNLGLSESIQQTFRELVIHTPHATVNFELPWTFSTFNYRLLCQMLYEQSEVPFETAKVNGRTDFTVHTDRGDVSAPLIVDALGWRRVLGSGANVQPPNAKLSRGLEVHPNGSSPDLEIWIDRKYVPAGYGWSFPADQEIRVGVGSFDPRFHVKDTTLLLADDLNVDAVNFQGNWIPHQIRPATDSGVFFVGDSAGHCLPLTAEGIRPAFYFGLAAGRELRSVIEGEKTRAEALRAYGSFSAEHAWKYRWMLRSQDLVPKIPPQWLARMLRAMDRKSFLTWSFNHYLNIAPPEFAEQAAVTPQPQRALVS